MSTLLGDSGRKVGVAGRDPTVLQASHNTEPPLGVDLSPNAG